MLNLILRLFIMYFVLTCFIRATGKRQIGEMELSELITAFLISELAVSPLTDTDIPLLYAITLIICLFALEVTISFLITKCPVAKRFFEGMPSILINNGTLDIKELAKQRMSVEELLSSLRLNEKSEVESISYAILEPNGRLSAFDKTSAPAFPLIVDGKVIKENLKVVNKDIKWLNSALRHANSTLESVFLLTATPEPSPKLYFIYKNVNKKN